VRTLRTRTLPLRLWLVLAVVAVTGAGFLAQMGLVAPVAAWEQQQADARLASVRQILGTDTARWHDPAWQRHADTSLAALGVDVALFPVQAQTGQTGQPSAAIYATAGARRFLDTGDLNQDASRSAVNEAPAIMQPGASAPVFQRIVIANPAQPATQPPVGVAMLWETLPASGALLGLMWAIVELSSFALTLAIVVWLIGLPVLRPLAAMSQAAQDIAGGDLGVRLPSSPVREIADVSAALEGMSAALRDALTYQAGLEDERKLFVGAIAHDLRTPLFMLRGYLKGLESGVAATPAKVEQYVSACRAKADELERLVADLFAYARLEYLEQEPERAPLELDALLRQIIEGAQPLAAAKELTLALDAPRGAYWLMGDSHLLARAVENLLDNALRHTPAGGTIHVRLSGDDTAIVFAVEDSGPGIAARDLPHLFTPLYRGDTSRNRQTGGAGLGLAIAQRILRAHGGDLTAANSRTGGAVFTGTLPAKRGGAPHAEQVVAATPA
jgi:signal transduction histidine kinase